MNPKFARSLFGAALALYTLWIVALIALAIVSGERPVSGAAKHAPAPATSPSETERTSD